jgi:hypothetical protein
MTKLDDGGHRRACPWQARDLVISSSGIQNDAYSEVFATWKGLGRAPFWM